GAVRDQPGEPPLPAHRRRRELLSYQRQPQGFPMNQRSAQTVLIVDDEPDIRELLSITLERMGLASRCAATLQEARHQLQQQVPDLCLTDMRLPDGNGISLVELIQRDYPELPVAVITAHGSVETAISALKSGAFDFISKPIELERLRS